MINLLLLLFFLTCIGASASWLAENPGNVVIHWFGYRIDTSFAFLLLMALVAAFILAYVYIFLRHVAHVPEHFSKRRGLKHYQKGLSELTYSVAALAGADFKQAALHTQNAEKLLGPMPLTLLLNAQIAKNAGDETRTRQLLTHMLEFKETEYLAARSLCDTANKQHLLPKALELARRAHELNPRDIAPLLSLHIRLGQWQQAMQVITKSTRKARLTRYEIQHYKSIVLLKQGTYMLDNGHDHAALAVARQCLKQQPLAPCIAFAAKAYAACGKKNKAIRLILYAWKNTPHAELAEALRVVIASDTKDQQMKIVRKLVAMNPTSNESDIALAQTAMRHKDWGAARTALMAALEKSETVRTCQLLAELETGEYPDFDISSKWIARSVAASNDPIWICSACGQASQSWDAHCHNCEAFDSLEWKKRDMHFVG